MHYGIVAIGSRGDVQPYIALALGMMDRGHQATVMAHENFKNLVEDYGVSFHALDGNVEDLLKSPEGMQVLRSGKLSAFLKYLQKTVRLTLGPVTRDLFEGCRQADVLVTSLLGIPWMDSIAEKQNKPWAIVQLNLPTTITSEFPLAGIDYFDFPFYNRLTYRLLEVFHWMNNRKPVNTFRRSIGLPPMKIPLLKKIREEKILNLHCFSPSLKERPADWPANTAITGFLFLPEKNRKNSKLDELSPELLRFIEDGPSPVYIGFGSIPVPDADLFIRVISVLLEKTHDRFIYCGGWSDPIALPQNPRLLQIKTANHDWLFPRCRAAIIHGGVGTTAAVLKARIPVIIISIIADQPWWGKIIEDKGVGVHIPFRKLTAEKLLAAIRKTQSLQMKSEASALGERINQEDGLGETVEVLENYFNQILLQKILK